MWWQCKTLIGQSVHCSGWCPRSISQVILLKWPKENLRWRYFGWHPPEMKQVEWLRIWKWTLESLVQLFTTLCCKSPSSNSYKPILFWWTRMILKSSMNEEKGLIIMACDCCDKSKCWWVLKIKKHFSKGRWRGTDVKLCFKSQGQVFSQFSSK